MFSWCLIRDALDNNFFFLLLLSFSPERSSPTEQSSRNRHKSSCFSLMNYWMRCIVERYCYEYRVVFNTLAPERKQNDYRSPRERKLIDRGATPSLKFKTTLTWIKIINTVKFSKFSRRVKSFILSSELPSNDWSNIGNKILGISLQITDLAMKPSSTLQRYIFHKLKIAGNIHHRFIDIICLVSHCEWVWQALSISKSSQNKQNHQRIIRLPIWIHWKKLDRYSYSSTLVNNVAYKFHRWVIKTSQLN